MRGTLLGDLGCAGCMLSVDRLTKAAVLGKLQYGQQARLLECKDMPLQSALLGLFARCSQGMFRNAV